MEHNSPLIPPIKLSFPTNDNRSKSEPVSYKHLENESTSEYIERILQNNRTYYREGELIDRFIELLAAKSEVFNQVVEELPSRLLMNGYRVTLLEAICKTNDFSRINKLIEVMRDRQELKKDVIDFLKKEINKNQFQSESAAPARRTIEFCIENSALTQNMDLAPLNADSICYQLLLNVYMGRDFEEIMQALILKDIKAPLLELVLGVAASPYDRVDLLKSLIDDLSSEELSKFIHLDALKLRMGTTKILKINLFMHPIEPYHTLLDVAAMNDNWKLVDYLLHAIKDKGDSALKLETSLWKKTNPYFIYEKNMNSIKKHNELLENEQLSNSKVTYRAHSQKTGHKALIARHSSNKIQRKNIKKVFINLINAKFEIGIADTMIPDPSLKLQFYLKNESGELDKYEIYQGMKRDIMVKNEQIIVRMDGEFVELINQKFLSSILKGSHLEVFHLNFSNRHESSEFWNDWSSNKAWDEYTNVIHPILIGSIIEILSQSTYSSPPVILEVGGGTGRFACKLLNEYQKPSQYIMLELNEEELKIARKEFKSRACAVKTDIVNDSQFFQDEAKLNPILENSVDLAIASGVLTNVVLQDKDAAIKAMHSIYHYIKPGGFFVVAGHATSFLNSEDFKLAGFEVINTSIPDNGKEFYILRKLPSHT